MGTQRVAIVTGGMAGIGLATVNALMDAGHKVAVGARRADDTEAIAAFRASAGDDVMLHHLDVRSTGSVAAFCEAVEADLGPVDILVNNAGISTYQFVAEHDHADWERVIDVNLNGPFRMTRACLGGMKERGWGRVINVASTAARTAVATSAAYSASKSGLLGLTRAVAIEGAPHGVSCVAVSPTWIETDMLSGTAAKMAADAGTTVEEEIANIANANPQKRLVQPQEVAALIAFLAGETSPALTMEDIQVNAAAHW